MFKSYYLFLFALMACQTEGPSVSDQNAGEAEQAEQADPAKAPKPTGVAAPEQKASRQTASIMLEPLAPAEEGACLCRVTGAPHFTAHNGLIHFGWNSGATIKVDGQLQSLDKNAQQWHFSNSQYKLAIVIEWKEQDSTGLWTFNARVDLKDVKRNLQLSSRMIGECHCPNGMEDSDSVVF